MADTANADTVTVLQGAFMKEGVKRPATPQETLLLHNVYKVAVSLIENTSTNDKKRRDFQDRNKVICIKHTAAEGKPTEWDIEAVAWCDNVFKIFSEVWPILKDIKELHELLGTLDVAVTPESRNLVAPKTSLEIGEGRKRGCSKKSRKESLSKGIGGKSEQTGKDDYRKRGRTVRLG